MKQAGYKKLFRYECLHKNQGPNWVVCVGVFAGPTPPFVSPVFRDRAGYYYTYAISGDQAMQQIAPHPLVLSRQKEGWSFRVVEMEAIQSE